MLVQSDCNKGGIIDKAEDSFYFRLSIKLMLIEDNLHRYLLTSKKVLVRGIDTYRGMKFLKDFVDAERQFNACDNPAVMAILKSIGLKPSTAEFATKVVVGDLSNLDSLSGTVWYFAESGSSKQRRDADNYFKTVLSFREDKLMGIKNKL